MKLHEAIAVRKGEVGRAKGFLTKIYQAFQKPVLFGGFTKAYENIVDGGEVLPSESKRVQRKANDDLNHAQTALAAVWDIVATVEDGNRKASADIEINGDSILTNVSVTTLLFLEKQLDDLRTVLAAIPVLSSDFDWTKDENDGLFKTPPIKTHRNKKVTQPIVKYDATEFHPAQTDLITVDLLAGYWNDVKHSGALPSTRKNVILYRLEQMSDAVKTARARANGEEAPKVDIASPILKFIFGE